MILFFFSVIKSAVGGLKTRRLVLFSALATALVALLSVMLLSSAAENALFVCARRVSGDLLSSSATDLFFLPTALLSSLSSLLLFWPLFVGFERLVFLSVNGKNVHLSEVLWCYSEKRVFRLFYLKILVFLRLSGWVLLFVFPSMCIASFFDGAYAVFASCILFGIGFFVGLVKLVSYGATDFVFITGEHLSARKIISRSVSLFGPKSDLFSSVLSMVLCFVPFVFAMPLLLPIFLVVPLFVAGLAIIFRRAAESDRVTPSP